MLEFILYIKIRPYFLINSKLSICGRVDNKNGLDSPVLPDSRIDARTSIVIIIQVRLCLQCKQLHKFCWMYIEYGRCCWHRPCGVIGGGDVGGRRFRSCICIGIGMCVLLFPDNDDVFVIDFVKVLTVVADVAAIAVGVTVVVVESNIDVNVSFEDVDVVFVVVVLDVVVKLSWPALSAAIPVILSQCGSGTLFETAVDGLRLQKSNSMGD